MCSVPSLYPVIHLSFLESTDSIFGSGFHDKANVLFTERCLGIKEAEWDGPEPAQLYNSTPSTGAATSQTSAEWAG